MKISLLLFFLLKFSLPSLAQQAYVLRTININDTENQAAHHLCYAGIDKSFASLLQTAITTGSIPLYSHADCTLKTRLSAAEVKKITAPKRDTIAIVDFIASDITSQDSFVVRIKDENYRNIAVLEEWHFDAYSGKTSMQIKALAVWSDWEDELNAEHILFLVSYNDIKPILAQYEQFHPTNTLSQLIWKDYFLSDIKPKPTN